MDGLDVADGTVLRNDDRIPARHGGVGEYVSPGGAPRIGILRFETTRGDRLFLSLLGSAYIHIAWLGFVNLDLWWATALSLIYAYCVFRLV